MQRQKDISYWLFQIKPSDFQLEKALSANELKVYPVKSGRSKIRKGDKIIIWKVGRKPGCYALATAASEIGRWPYSENERAFFNHAQPDAPNVKLRVDLNLWNNPLESKQLAENRLFNRFGSELPGINYKVTQRHYTTVKELAQENLKQDRSQEVFVPFRKSTDHPLNLILFGPPGTGKTYTAISLAVAIIENKSLVKISRDDRTKLRMRFNEYMTEGQIGFVTFHHAYTYEDFVEGVKPHAENKSVTFKIEEGIFKQLAFEAKRNMLETLMSSIPKKAIKISFNQLYKSFVQYVKSDQFKSFVSKNDQRIYLHRIARNGDFIVRKEKSYNTITISKNKLKSVYDLGFGADQVIKNNTEVREIIGEINFNIFHGVYKELKKFETEFTKALAMLQQKGEASDKTVESFEFGALADQIKDQTKKYVLIIDEINRGDISKIFGELITLVEEDKREGNAEGLIVQLPYSKSHFCVPSNLYIIGTMNTAGQSLDQLDLALRRRFDFLEMEPDPAVIKKVNKTKVIDGIDLVKMINAINERIEILLGRDYRIGYTYFLNLASLADLKEVFLYKIIPLLLEYFEGDYLRIGLVLGKDFVKKSKVKNTAVFADFDLSVFEAEALETYKMQSIEKLSREAFIRIYDKE